MGGTNHEANTTHMHLDDGISSLPRHADAQLARALLALLHVYAAREGAVLLACAQVSPAASAREPSPGALSSRRGCHLRSAMRGTRRVRPRVRVRRGPPRARRAVRTARAARAECGPECVCAEGPGHGVRRTRGVARRTVAEDHIVRVVVIVLGEGAHL